ncbi:Sulfatase [Planctomycetes bacterium MalM25]|nr:Sulfatase [Planctomycetes bacterium MalM25]
MVSFSSVRVVLGVALLLISVGASLRADDSPPRPNLLVITVEGLDNVGVPAEGLEEVLFDPEVRARVTPNLERLVAKGARFDKAYGLPISLRDLAEHARLKGKYDAEGAKADASKPPPHDRQLYSWFSPSREPLRSWIKQVPKDPTIANWELLADSQGSSATAMAVAKGIGKSEGAGRPRLLVAQLASHSVSPYLPGVFFDRFPLDQIRLPADPNARRALAERMGAYDFDATDLTEDEELRWKQAIQAWLAGVCKLDYAIGTLVDALEASDTPWAVALVASPLKDLSPEQAIGEAGARSGLVLVAPGVTQPGQRITTPVELSSLARTLAELVDIDPHALMDSELLKTQPYDGPVNPFASLPGESLLPLLAPAGERYDMVAITSADGSYGVRSHRFRLVHTDDSQSLYDLEKDPEGFYDLLDPAYAAKVERFALSGTQVEAVRKWLTRQLYYRLTSGDAEKVVLDKLASLAGLDPDEDNGNKPPAVLPGDYNRDGRVDAADTTIWRDQNGKEVPVGSGADGDFDGRVDDLDNIIWRMNYGRRAEAP